MPNPTAISCDFVGQTEKPKACQRVSRDVSWEEGGPGDPECSQPCSKVGALSTPRGSSGGVLQRETRGIVGCQGSFSSAGIAELLLCARQCARCLRLCTKMLGGRREQGLESEHHCQPAAWHWLRHLPSLSLRSYGQKLRLWTR